MHSNVLKSGKKSVPTLKLAMIKKRLVSNIR